MTTVLVTGGAGFIGSHLVDALLARGERVRVLDNLDPLAHRHGAPSHLDRAAELQVGDLRDPEAVHRALDGVDRVFHLGGVVGNGESMVNVRRSVRRQLVGDRHSDGGGAAATRPRAARGGRVFMVVYGEGSYACSQHGRRAPALRPVEQLRRREWEPRCDRCGRELTPVATSEDAPLRPTSVYGITKRDQEELVLVLGRAYGLETVALRYLNVYGPRQALANPYTGVAAIFAARLRNGRPPLVFEDGRQIRDLVHVSDVVAGTLAAMDAPAARGHAINIATGRRVRVVDLARAVARALGSGIEPELTGEFRAGDIRHCFADVRLAGRLLGFEAGHSLDQGLPELAEWVAAQQVEERGDEAVALLRERGLVG